MWHTIALPSCASQWLCFFLDTQKWLDFESHYIHIVLFLCVEGHTALLSLNFLYFVPLIQREYTIKCILVLGKQCNLIYLHTYILRILNLVNSTWTYRSILQDRINVQVGQLFKVNKRAGFYKAMQARIWLILLKSIKVFGRDSPKQIEVQDGIRTCRIEFFKKSL